MKYELSLLEELAADPGIDVQPETEIARVRQTFMVMALSHKKEIYLRRYFRVHYDGLNSLIQHLREQPRRKESKQLLQISETLLQYITDHFARYLAAGLQGGEGLDPDDPDIDAQKVITTFNLSELGVIIRLFIETGIFRVRNQKALTRFMSKNVVIRTKKVPEMFSEDHLYNAIHSPAEPAMNRMQVVLNQMLTQLNKLRRDQRKKG
jgi:hypothetical protein